jgi:hypothetical protein
MIRYEDCVIDLETTDTGNNSQILSIGAVLLNKSGGPLGPTFYRVIDRASCKGLGFTTSQATMYWWGKQSEDARKVFTDPGMELTQALTEFAKFLEDNSNDVKVWGNGSDFDNVILKNAYLVTKEKLPWDYRNNRCYRTYRNIALVRPRSVTFVGIRHNALDDAIHEAKNLQALYKANTSLLRLATYKITRLIKKGFTNVQFRFSKQRQQDKY